MEYILAILFSSNNILNKSAGVNLFYVFAAVLFVYYLWMKKKALLQIVAGVLIAAAYTGIVWLLGANRDLMQTGRFLLIILFNITLMVYIVRDRYKWSMLRWCCCMALLHGVETVVALFMRESSLWGTYHYGEIATSKLQLFYREPSVLCMVSGLLFIYFVYKSLESGITVKAALGCGVALVDMYYSFNLAGIITCGIALVVLLISHLIRNQHHIKKDPRSTIIWLVIFGLLGVTVVASVCISPVYSARIMDALQGKDVGFIYTVSDPFGTLVKTLSATGGKGLGIGAAIDTLNSFVRVMTEGGIVGIVLVAALIFTLLALVILHGGILDAALFTFVILYQFVAGQFTNPVFWFVYGWIIADCVDYHKVQQERQEKREEFGDDIPVTVAIIGSKGLANYGGYETFTDKLTEYHRNNKNVKYMIACKGNGHGVMDETKLTGAHPIDDSTFTYHNAYCFKINVPQIGSAQAIIYDFLAARYVINYFRKHKTEKPVLYILTCRIGPFIKWIARAMHEIGGVYYLNPDGHEFLRANWSPAVRRYWKISEQLMVKYADLVICDSKNIETYIQASYEQYKPKTTFIPYGADLGRSPLADDDARYTQWMNEFGITPNEYYLIVGRLVPENNYETMIREFLLADTKRDLVVITNGNQKLLDELEEKLNYSADPRIKFTGTVYDQDLLRKIRENAFAYLHGHEVGGTNPSLIEALASTKVNLLYDVGFNRECAESSALYWGKEEGELADLIAQVEQLDEATREKMDKESTKRVVEVYNWEKIAGSYEKRWRKAGKK